MADPDRRFAPATARNRAPIIDVLARVLPASGRVLEVASGTGEHVVAFAARFPALAFQPSDPDPAARSSIVAWIVESGLTNVAAPIALDAASADWPVDTGSCAAVLCINMVHISPWAATTGLMRGASAALAPDGVLYLYGPYKRAGVPTAPSNEAFDADLRARDPRWGVRDLEAVVDEAERAGFALAEVVAMPANNLSVVLRRRD